MIYEYDYTCPYCGKVQSANSSCPAPFVGALEQCIFCKEVGKIKHAKLVYQAIKVVLE